MKRKSFISLMAVLAAAGALSACGGSSSTAAGAADSASSAASGQPADRLEAARQRGTLIVALEGAWSPWCYHDDTDTLVGYDVEVSRAIAEYLGLEPEYVEGEWDGLFAGLEAGRYDIVCNGVEVTEERAKSYDFSEPYAYIHTALAVREDNTDITSFEDLAGKTVGVQLGTTGDLLMSEEVGEGEDKLGIAGVEQYNKAADAVQALLTNKIDAVCIDDQVAKNFVAANPDELTTLDTAFAEESYAIAVSKDNPDLTEQLNGAIAELKEDGTLDAILDKYIAKVEGAEGYVSPEGTEYPNGTLVMATNATFDPYEYIENGEIVGIDAEFAKALCDKLGYDLHIEDMEFDSIIAAVNSGKADFGMAGMTVTPERQEQIDFTDTYCTAAQSIIVLK